jgi:tRNA(His) 5'-end guanylyltransferase
MLSLKDRITDYIALADHRLLGRVPIILHINGRGFSRTTSLCDKPYDVRLGQTFYATMIALLKEIEGACFGYTYNDQIWIVARNDTDLSTRPWFNGSVAKIVSVVSSLATINFDRCADELDVNLITDPIFLTQAFIVPTTTEAVNVFIFAQQEAFKASVNTACLYELLKKFPKPVILDKLANTSLDEKIAILKEETGVDYYSYPQEFRMGVAAYRQPQKIDFEGETKIKDKWALDIEVPSLTDQKDWLPSILRKKV